MTDPYTDSEWPSLTATAEIRWIELTALQRDLLELFYRRDRQSDADTATLTEIAVQDQLAEWYGDAVRTDSVESVLADFVDRSLLTTVCRTETDKTGMQYMLTSAGRVLFAERVVTLTTLLTDDATETDPAAGDTEGQQ